jgi:hypothetical protein
MTDNGSAHAERFADGVFGQLGTGDERLLDDRAAQRLIN